MKNKPKIVIWGAGNKLKEVHSALDYDRCDLVGIVDKNIDKQESKSCDEHEIVAPYRIDFAGVDYVVVSVQSANSVIKDAENIGISREKLLPFWKCYKTIPFVKETYKLKRENEILRLRLQNAPYEFGNPEIKFLSIDNLFYELEKGRKSLSRFGDGEFEIIRGNKRGWFQTNDELLSRRLLEILQSHREEVIVAIADNFGSLDKYTDESADGIREYLLGETRTDILRILEKNRLYGDAYITRPYFMYRDKKYIERIIELFKRLWNNRRVIVVENSYAHIGVGNDLLDNTVDVKRIIIPHKDAYSAYDEILSSICKYAKGDDLILISAGQTATVLSYDLGLNGYQAIDIGQLDTEYEWYLRNATERIEIPGKSVAELLWWHEPEAEENDTYIAQICCTIR